MHIASDSFQLRRRIPPQFAMGTPDGFGANRNPQLQWDDVPPARTHSRCCASMPMRPPNRQRSLAAIC